MGYIHWLVGLTIVGAFNLLGLVYLFGRAGRSR